MLQPEELAKLDDVLLPLMERHHLRILAHALRTLQAIAQRQTGDLPAAVEIELWAQNQVVMADDPSFARVFVDQLVAARRQLLTIAKQAGVDPLAVQMDHLVNWARSQANHRLTIPLAGANPPRG